MTENTNYCNLQTGFVDIHCHCLAGLDDGPENMPDSLTLCRALVDDGITVAIATPHQLGQFDGCNDPSIVRKAVSELNNQLENNRIPLTIMPGGDVRIDERMGNLIDTDKVQTLADGKRYILLELPTRIFIDIEPLIIELAGKGIHGIISHPERHHNLSSLYKILPKWLDCHSYLQITAGSLTGDFGSAAQKAAWDFLSLGWVSFVATDAHNLRGRKPRMRTAYNEICKKLGQQTAHLVCIENPIKLLEGRDITYVSLNRHQGVIK